MGRGGFQKPSWFELKVAAVVSSSLFNGRGQVSVSPDVGTGSQSPRTGPSGALSSSSTRTGRENAKAAVKKKSISRTWAAPRQNSSFFQGQNMDF